MTPPSTYPTRLAQLKHEAPETDGHERRDAVSGVDSSTFGEGVRLLPDTIQTDIRQLYYVLRTIDDLVDEHQPDASPRLQAVERWARHEQDATSEETELLSDLAKRHDLDRPALLQFCEGMRHDLDGAAIRDEADLERYCQQAGGAVGVLLAGILGATDPSCAAGMAMLGRAMQRTNILRDIDEDRANGRLYIPRSTIERHGFPAPGRREQLLREQIPIADALYEEGEYSIRLLAHGRRAMALATALYREILRQIERDGYGRTAGRATVPEERKRALIAECTAAPCRAYAEPTIADGPERRPRRL